MNHSLKILLIMAATIALSGCAGRRITGKNNLAKSINTETLSPLAKPVLRSLTQTNLNLVHNDNLLLPLNNYLLDQDKSIEVIISEYGYTRLSIEDERITDVFIYPQESMQVKIHQQGYLILVPVKHDFLSESEQSTDNKIQLTITGEQGTTQDFSLRLIGIAPEPIKFVKTNLESSNIINGDQNATTIITK
jgi:hypothetical protein